MALLGSEWFINSFFLTVLNKWSRIVRGWCYLGVVGVKFQLEVDHYKN